ncbi:RNA methyltransferase, RsmE family [Corynebacterium matruchotii ATCC 14266]|uniref:Ribosomal RNA small subunit methyltransferase E n=1 Tax=Corynebacterium matruchotii ATCC 14266 TaxID=553207 RepID=E0DGF9_9CORY|nr:RNA methyltransferase, RsmE family [Corynebacterium matruchotii ATCC 14266]KAB1925767.1 16S rRNA (uracil(1498)-N(3))-methyltransferase [Corynebacterium matruchotii]
MQEFPTPPTVGKVIELTGDEGRHAVSVKRTSVGEQIELVDGHGTRAVITVTGVSGKDRLVGVVDCVASEPAPRPTVTVVQALPKAARSELTVDLLTQAGADVIVPWQAGRSVANWGKKQDKGLAKWRAAARAAAKQSRRSRIPEITPVADQAAVVALIQAAPLALMLHEDATGKITDQPVAQVDSVVLIIGPEGGISPAELDAFTAAGAHPVRLGPEVLRTASAGMVALAALGAVTDRW